MRSAGPGCIHYYVSAIDHTPNLYTTNVQQGYQKHRPPPEIVRRATLRKGGIIHLYHYPYLYSCCQVRVPYRQKWVSGRPATQGYKYLLVGFVY